MVYAERSPMSIVEPTIELSRPADRRETPPGSTDTRRRLHTAAEGSAPTISWNSPQCFPLPPLVAIFSYGPDPFHSLGNSRLDPLVTRRRTCPDLLLVYVECISNSPFLVVLPVECVNLLKNHLIWKLSSGPFCTLIDKILRRAPAIPKGRYYHFARNAFDLLLRPDPSRSDGVLSKWLP